MMLETRRQAMAHFLTKCYANGWPEAGLAICARLEAFFFGKVDSKVARNINATIHPTNVALTQVAVIAASFCVGHICMVSGGGGCSCCIPY